MIRSFISGCFILATLIVSLNCQAKTRPAQHSGREGSFYNQIYIFGDSISDAGYFDLDPSLPPGKQATFTTLGGFVWGQYLGKDLIGARYNLEANNLYGPANPNVSNRKNGTDYAIGGATTGRNLINPDTSMAAQIDNYLNHNPTINTSGLYILWGGANDIFLSYDKPNPDQAVATAAQNVVSEAVDLIRHGVKHLFIINLPDLSLTPAYAGNELIHRLSLEFNSNLKNDVARSGFVINIFDEFSQQKAVVDTLSTKGIYVYEGLVLNKLGQACPGYALHCNEFSNGFLYSDTMHPSDTAHHILAEKLYDFVTSGTLHKAYLKNKDQSTQ